MQKTFFLLFFSPCNLTKNTANVVLLQFTAADEQILVRFFLLWWTTWRGIAHI